MDEATGVEAELRAAEVSLSERGAAKDGIIAAQKQLAALLKEEREDERRRREEMLREERIFSIRALERSIRGELVYEGSMRDYLVTHGVAITRDESYFENVTRRRAAWEACAAVATLLRGVMSGQQALF